MTYNIHPIIVHFPIALLFLYSVIKILPLKRFVPSIAWTHVEKVILLFGVLGAFVASSTGELAEELINPNHDIVEMHERFASITTWIYGILLIGELLAYINIYIIQKLRVPEVIKFFYFIHKILTHSVLSKVLALAGLVTLTITGALGGAMVRGFSSDPLAPFIFRMLGLEL